MIVVFRSSVRLLTTAWRIDRRKTSIAVGLMLAFTLSTPLLAIVLGRMTDEVVGGNAGAAAVAGAIVAVLAVGALSFGRFGHVAYFELSELIELELHENLLTVSNGSPGIDHHERPGQADELTVLHQNTAQFRSSLEALLNAGAQALAIVLSGIVLAVQHPLLLLLPLAAVAPLAAGRYAEKVLDAAGQRTAEATRAALNLYGVATGARYAGEIRVSGVQAELRRRHAELWQSATRGRSRANLTAAALRAAGQVVFGLAYVGAVLLVLRGAVAGHRSIGEVVLVITLATQVNQQVTAAVGFLQDLQRLSNTYQRLDRLRAAVDLEPVGEPVAPPARLRRGITFEKVGFTYPSADRPALHDLDLTLPAGRTVAIVGENGAGKTTLVKLLCGFYQPTAGRIRADDVDLRDVRHDEWRRHIAAGFQDFVRYETTAQQTVGVGDVTYVNDEDAVRAALARAHVGEMVGQLGQGLDTQLGTSWTDGAELSGGQWQKLALGRALMRTSPLLLLLDEPTSALDPQAEHDLFERYAEQARATAERTGAVTVLVSHRFSTVRMADLILVMGDHRVIEAGDHDTLVRAGGPYAEMFGIQADAYR